MSGALNSSTLFRSKPNRLVMLRCLNTKWLLLRLLSSDIPSVFELFLLRFMVVAIV